MDNNKTKEKGNIKNTGKVIAKGVQFLNGDECFRFYKVPIILIDYESPESAHPYAKGERFKFWIKLEDAGFKRIEEQLKKDLKEISIWFDEENKAKLNKFLQEEKNGSTNTN